MTPEAARLKYVRLTVARDLPFPFTDRYDGVPVTVLAGSSENLPLDMAQHFFGPTFDPVAQQRHVAKRQGWNTPEFVQPDKAGKTKAQRYFDMLKIEPVSYRLVEEAAPDPTRPVPAEQNIAEDDTPARRGPGRPRNQATGAAA
jgi:hypothetical protein